MSSSGLIYAVIVGAWAAYLVPMWLRRQDELNEARPTERFSTAIRLLSGRAGMERRYAKELDERHAAEADALDGAGRPAEPDVGGPGADPDVVTDSVDVRAFAVSASSETPAHDEVGLPADAPVARAPKRSGASGAERRARSKVLARRRRTTMVLFLAFTLGAIVAAVGGLAFLWAPVVPALLLSAYIVHLRAQERRRFAFTMDQRRAEAAAQRLRERRPRQEMREGDGEADTVRAQMPDPVMPTVRVPAPASPLAADRRALVEQTDHAEWVDQQRERRPTEGESWEPVPVPLPTYVTAPVAPRAAAGVDLEAGDAWSSARSSAAEPAVDLPEQAAGPAGGGAAERRSRERGRTPLFDQYADESRPRAANE